AALVWSRAVLTETETEAEASGEASAEGRRSGLLEAAALYGEAAAAYGELPRPYSQALTTEGAARCAIAADTEGAPDDEGASGPVPDAEAASRPAPAPEEDAILPVLAELESCAQRFTDLGAVWDAARARALLRTRQPVRKGRPPGRPSHADQLSPREEEVAQLAVSGLTNREIAATLHLSPRTVEQHIAGAMRKTGALSRRDLAHRLDATP
ncbi:helix-turn-helix transcriptional regulator, partial [Streptomyces sp. MBT57]|nr:helix-turn-helix transcriptional regulator [Streptomyces sp. MBT57]